jgi:hypothetical protein
MYYLMVVDKKYKNQLHIFFFGKIIKLSRRARLRLY